MPRTNTEVIEKVETVVAKSKGGLTSAEVAKKLDIPERTARRYLTRLFVEKKLTREGAYVEAPAPKGANGASIRFYYRYSIRAAKAKPAKAKPT